MPDYPFWSLFNNETPIYSPKPDAYRIKTSKRRVLIICQHRNWGLQFVYFGRRSVWQLIRLSNQFHRRLMKFVFPENMYVRDVGTAGENTRTQPSNQPVLELLAMVICHSNNSRGCEKVCFFVRSLARLLTRLFAAFIWPPANRQRLSSFLQLWRSWSDTHKS